MNRKKALFYSFFIGVFLTGCAGGKQPEPEIAMTNHELAEAVAYLIGDINSSDRAVRDDKQHSSTALSIVAADGNLPDQHTSLGCNENGSSCRQANDALLATVEKIDAYYLTVTTAQEKRIEELERRIEELSKDKGGMKPSERSVVLNKSLPKEERISPDPKTQLGDLPCTADSSICYVSVAGVNVRANPCADNMARECSILRVQSYGEAVYVLEEKEGLTKPDTTWYRVNEGGWVRDYTLRELDPSIPAKVFVAEQEIGVVSNPFNGNILSSIEIGEQIEISGCALGWCKLHKKPGYILHENIEKKEN